MLYLCLIFYFILLGLVEFFLGLPQSGGECLGRSLVSIWDRALRGGVLVLGGFLLVLGGRFISGGGMGFGYDCMEFSGFLIFSSFLGSQVLSSFATCEATHIYNMFINNNHASFHLWWQKNLVKHQKFSEHYDHDCRIAWKIFYYF